MACPHCGLPGVCPPGTCFVRDEYNLLGLPRATAAAPKPPRQMPTAASKPAAPAKPTPKKAPAKPKLAAPVRYSKAEILALWKQAGKDDKTLVVKPVPSNFRGSRLPLFTLRISGSLSEVKATLGKLKTLLRYEAGTTRLDVKLGQLTEKGSTTPVAGAWVCYIQVVERA